MFVRVDVHDASAFSAYAAAVLPLVERHGGRVLSAGPADRVEGPETTRTTLAFVQRWPSSAAFFAFYTDPEYQPLKALRLAAADTQITVVGMRARGIVPEPQRP